MWPEVGLRVWLAAHVVLDGVVQAVTLSASLEVASVKGKLIPAHPVHTFQLNNRGGVGEWKGRVTKFCFCSFVWRRARSAVAEDQNRTKVGPGRVLTASQKTWVKSKSWRVRYPTSVAAVKHHSGQEAPIDSKDCRSRRIAWARGDGQPIGVVSKHFKVFWTIWWWRDAS